MMPPSPYWNYTAFDPICVQIQHERVDARLLEQHLRAQAEQMSESQTKRERVYVIIDVRDGHRPPPEVRKLQAEWMDEHRELIAETCLGMGFVIEEPIVRGALTAIFWVSRPPVPHRVHGTLGEAISHAVWVCDQLGVAVPDNARRDDAAPRIELAHRRTHLGRVS